MNKYIAVLFICLGVAAAINFTHGMEQVSEIRAANCKIVQDNLLRHADNMITAYEGEKYTRSFIETIKMSKLIPFIQE